MKRIVTILTGIMVFGMVSAQEDTTKVKILDKNVVTVVENSDGTRVKVGNDDGVEVITDEKGDTTKIRIGRKVFRVSEGKEGTRINITREDRNKNHRSGSFNAHWSGIEVGMNMFRDQDYSLYRYSSTPPFYADGFMDLNLAKSLTWNFNFSEISFKNKQNTVGLVTGIGLSFMDFAFDKPLTIAKAEGTGRIIPVDLEVDGLKKSKLNVSYLTVPLMLEIKTPLEHNGKHLYLAGGVIGGLNIGSHTKYKYEKNKEKVHSNYNLNPFKYDFTGRIGFGDFCIFANYGMTPLFKEGKGPGLYPLTFGISFPNI